MRSNMSLLKMSVTDTETVVVSAPGSLREGYPAVVHGGGRPNSLWTYFGILPIREDG